MVYLSQVEVDEELAYIKRMKEPKAIEFLGISEKDWKKPTRKVTVKFS